MVHYYSLKGETKFFIFQPGVERGCVSFFLLRYGPSPAHNDLILQLFKQLSGIIIILSKFSDKKHSVNGTANFDQSPAQLLQTTQFSMIKYTNFIQMSRAFYNLRCQLIPGFCTFFPIQFNSIEGKKRPNKLYLEHRCKHSKMQ